MVLTVGDIHRMYYWGRSKEGHNAICTAEAPIGHPHDWRGTGVALTRQPDNPHNSVGPAAPMVVPVSETRWLMYVVAKGVIERPGYLNDTILAAESHDAGRTWKYIGETPLISRDRDYDRHGSASMCVLFSGGIFRMWYTAFQYRERDELPWFNHVKHGTTPQHIPYLGIAYAESSDGITWRKPLDQLAIAPRGDSIQPVEHWVAKPWVLQTAPDAYRMWVSCIGATYRVHALNSRDGLSWEWDNVEGVPDLRGNTDDTSGLGPPGAFDDKMRGYTCVIAHGNELRCWYTGNGYGASGMGYASRPLDAASVRTIVA